MSEVVWVAWFGRSAAAGKGAWLGATLPKYKETVVLVCGQCVGWLLAWADFTLPSTCSSADAAFRGALPREWVKGL